MTSNIDLKVFFGSLTTKNGANNINFKTIDSNRDGEISLEEFNLAKCLYNCDSVTFSGLDKDYNGKIDEHEYEILVKQQDLQKILDTYKSKIARDYSGVNASSIPTVVAALKNFALNFIAEHSNDPNINESFRVALAEMYASLRTEEVSPDLPSSVVSRTVNNVYEQIINDSMSAKVKKALFDRISKIANLYAKTHSGDVNFENDLAKYLEWYMSTSDLEKLKEPIDKYKEALSKYGDDIAPKQLNKYKKDVEDFLRSAISQGITDLKLGQTVIRTEAAIKSALAKYNDGNMLKKDMDILLNSISALTETEKVIKAAENGGSSTGGTSVTGGTTDINKIPNTGETPGTGGGSNNGGTNVGNNPLINITENNSTVTSRIDKEMVSQILAEVNLYDRLIQDFDAINAQAVAYDKLLADSLHKYQVAEAYGLLFKSEQKNVKQHINMLKNDIKELLERKEAILKCIDDIEDSKKINTESSKMVDQKIQELVDYARKIATKIKTKTAEIKNMINNNKKQLGEFLKVNIENRTVTVDSNSVTDKTTNTNSSIENSKDNKILSNVEDIASEIKNKDGNAGNTDPVPSNKEKNDVEKTASVITDTNMSNKNSTIDFYL